MNKNKRALLFLLSWITISACGGGGSNNPSNDGDDGGDPGGGGASAGSIASFSLVPENPTLNEEGRFAFDVQGDGTSCVIDVRGDGSETITVDDCANVPNQSHTFTVTGEFEAILTVTDTAGNTVTANSSYVVFGGPIRTTWSLPQRNRIVDESLEIFVQITSEFEVAQVTGTFADQQFPVTVDQSGCGNLRCPFYRTTIPLPDLPWGPQLLQLVIEDVEGNQHFLNRTLRVDEEPVLDMRLPKAGTVARPNLEVDATCTDDNPNREPRLVAQLGIGEIDITQPNQIVDLSQGDSSGFFFHLACIDSAGQMDRRSPPVFVETSPKLIETLSLDSG
ncbi:MAG: hypothetical protein AAF438_20350, partial [Pseudomonadota bacterium]